MDIDSSIKEQMNKMVKINLLQIKTEMKFIDQAINPESKNQVQTNFKPENLMMKRVEV